MPIEITMPKLSDTMEEGTILKWRVKKGDRVRQGDVIAEVETDKAAMEMEAYEDGVVTDLNVEEGETVGVGTVIAVLQVEGEKEKKEKAPAQASPVEGREERPEERPRQEEKAPGAEKDREQKEAEGKEKGGDRQKEEEKPPPRLPSEKSSVPDFAVSPAARHLAREKGVDLSRVRGTGPGGRIVLADVERAAKDRATPRKEPSPPREAPRRERSVKIRRIIANKMVESWQNIPHFYVTAAVDMTEVIRMRKELGVTINDFIIAAVARSLQEHPWINSLWIDGEATEQKKVNISLAVATDRGLFNPVITDCASLSLKEISRRARELGEKAHAGRLAQEDLEGGTFTISNMGMLGVESFCAIITPPQAAVLAVGTVKGEAVMDDRGEPGVAPTVRLTLSADHRSLDGADAAEFLATLKSYLEAPVTLTGGRNAKEKD